MPSTLSSKSCRPTKATTETTCNSHAIKVRMITWLFLYAIGWHTSTPHKEAHYNTHIQTASTPFMQAHKLTSDKVV